MWEFMNLEEAFKTARSCEFFKTERSGLIFESPLVVFYIVGENSTPFLGVYIVGVS